MPVRFVRACRRGHIGDIDWYAFVHQRRRPTAAASSGSTSGGPAATCPRSWIRCECGQERQFDRGDASRGRSAPLGNCDGCRPWLGPVHEGGVRRAEPAAGAVGEQRLLPADDERHLAARPRRGASPRPSTRSGSTTSSTSRTSTTCAKERKKKPPVKAALEGLTDEEVFAEIEARKRIAAPGADKSVKQAEFETLIASKEEIGSDKPDGDFYARALPAVEPGTGPGWQPSSGSSWSTGSARWSPRSASPASRPSAPDVEGELEMGVSRAPLALDARWLPAIENRGEGVFLQFRQEAIEAWLERDAGRPPLPPARGGVPSAGCRTTRRAVASSRASRTSCSTRSRTCCITAVSLECGYPASSIRERVYALERRLRHPALHRLARTPRGRWAAWSRRAGRSPATSRRPSTWAGSAPTTRSAPSTTRRTRTSAASCTGRPATAAC